MTWQVSLPVVWKIAETPCFVTDGNQCGERAASTASTAVFTPPSVPFLNPTGIDSPEASSRWTWLSVVRAPIATHDVRSAMCCGICVSRNSDAVGSPRSLTSSSSLPREPQPLVDVIALVEVGIVDQPLPADRRARLLEVAPHHDDQLIGVASRPAAPAARHTRAPRSYRESSRGRRRRPAANRGPRARWRSRSACWRRRSTPARVIGISSSRIAGGISGRTWVMRRSSVCRSTGVDSR